MSSPATLEERAPIRTTPSKRIARDWAMALTARRVPFDVQNRGRIWEFYVPELERERALGELAELEAENKDWPPRHEFDLLADGTFGAGLWFALLCLFFVVQQTDLFGVAWQAAGRSDAALIRDGQWWRAVTALSLHVDLAHVAGNAISGALFFALVCQILGTPLAAAAVLSAGALGNLVNAYIQQPPFFSVGASTAVFAAIGILCAHGWQGRARFSGDRLRRFVPILIGIVFLGYLGVPSPEQTLGGKQVDVLAHVTGFGAGALLGGLLGRFAPRLRLGRGNVVMALCTPLVFCLCWWLALV